MNIDETIDAFRRGALDFDCKKMVLRRRNEQGERFDGQGYIRQSPDGALAFKLYVEKCQNATAFEHFAAQLSAVPGRLFAEDTFYDLDAIGRDGTLWKATHILPAIDWDATDGSALGRGKMQSITASLEIPQPNHYLRLHFFEEFNVPLHQMSRVQQSDGEYMLRDRAEFEAEGSEFEVRVREGSGDTIFEVISEAKFPTAFDLRIQEALQYITGKPAIWRARLQSQQNGLAMELASPRRRSVHTQFGPPISPTSISFHESGWKLYARYLAYVVANTEGTHWNPVAYHLYNACEATANSLDARAVGVSVAVEAVVGLIAAANDTARHERVTLFQQRMRQCLASQTDFADLTPRMEGLIAMMGHKRPQDTLYALADTGHVERAYVDAWTYLRNRHVHPTLKDLKNPNTIDYQKFLDHIHRVEVLLRQLTLYLIGYDGPFTDYGAPNFRSKDYPLKVTNSAKS